MLRTIHFIKDQSSIKNVATVDAYIIPFALCHMIDVMQDQIKKYVIIENLFPKQELRALDQLDITKIKGFFIKHADEAILNQMNLKLRELEANQKCAFGELSIIASIDTILGFQNASKLASYARVESLYVDLTSIMKDIKIGKLPSFTHVHYVKEKIILDTAKYQKTVIDACEEHRNLQEVTYLRDIGYGGVEVRVDDDIEMLNQLFLPTQDEIQTAKQIVDIEYETLLAGNKVVVVNGNKISEVMLKKARRLLIDAKEASLFEGKIPPIIKRKKIQKAKPAPTKFYSLGEEIANAISHGLGAVLGIAALVILIIKGIQHPNEPRYLVSGIIFSLSIVMLYLMSTLYHSLPLKKSAKQVFRRFDHASIYMLIAGSYTPFILLLLEGVRGFYVTIVMWSLAIIGITLKVIWIKKFSQIHLMLYIALGWLPVMFFFGELNRLGSIGLALLIAGGVSYTVGVLFYALKLFKFTHMVWHLFCIVGTLLHFLTVLFYL